MSTATLFHSAWGYNSSDTHIRIFPDLLRLFFSQLQEIDNFNIYSKEPSVRMGMVRVSSQQKLIEILRLVEEKILPDPELHNSSFIGFARKGLSSEAWLEFRVERPYLTVAAEDSVRLFLSTKCQCAERNASDIIALAERVASIDGIKEVQGWFQGKTTFFVGEPQLLYRPKLLLNFENRSNPNDVIESFWRMYELVSKIFPRNKILELLKRRSVDYRELEDGKVSARFCRAFDDVRVDADEIFHDITEIVDRTLKDNGLEKSWP